ncbi:hypothetical protein CSC80_12270 [Maribacter sp. 6B07]|uniref:hypothetical protein n=1 Tax=Maribacter sp. 6B07 TaxID=2045442 RepID=UPI000C087EA9|nr:hypothetical protein [Maribacter sp. 6B07]PHN93683.1 hypothetical protein CSC80_12270 [Maribacter sp. 6B07]
MDTKYYSCQYCHEDFLPKRRYVQKYCCDNCRSKAHHQKNKITNQSTSLPVTGTQNKIEKMSAAGIGNAAAGVLAADVVKSLITKNHNKPATKGDILALKKSYERYQRVLNLPRKPDGTLPYFDMETKYIVYLKDYR